MSTGLAVLTFVVALVATLGASELLILGVTRLGFKLGLAAGLVGLLTALGADSPEIASAMTAAFSGAHAVGVGVVVGSNLFNLAALFGVAGLVRSRIVVRRTLPAVDGSANLLITLLAAALVSGLAGPAAAMVPAALVLVAYCLLLAVPPRRLRHVTLPAWAARRLADLSGQIHPSTVVESHIRAVKGWRPVWLIAPALAVIVGGSVLMVTTVVLLGERWHVPPVVTGTILLAGLTSLPNLYAAVRLAQRREGATLVSEALNSNTLNLVAGLGIPAIVLGAGSVTGGAGPASFAWLLGLTAAALALTILQRGLTRAGSLALIAGYAAFLAFLLRGVF
jgi:cation:H+ antiporter